jgi:hypothetical protein
MPSEWDIVEVGKPAAAVAAPKGGGEWDIVGVGDRIPGTEYLGGKLPPVPGVQARVEPVSKLGAITETVAEVATRPLLSYTGGYTATEAYDRLASGVGSILQKAVGKGRPGTVRGAAEANLKFVNELVRGLPELADFAMTPLGAATVASQGAPMFLRAAMNAAFATDMGIQAKREIEEAWKNPTAENTGRAAKATIMALLPFLHGAQQEMQARRTAKLIKEHKTEAVELEPVPGTEPKPATPVMNREQRRATVLPPETGVPEQVERTMAAREAIIGKPREQWTNADIMAADDLIAQGYTGAGSGQPTVVPPAKPASTPSARTETPVPALAPVPTAATTPKAEAPAERVGVTDTSTGGTGTPSGRTPVEPVIAPKAPSPRKEVVPSAVEPKAGEGAGAPLPSTITEMSPREILADPVRFQFKRDTGGKAGVGEELKGVQTWNPELGGIMTVWRDPADGKVYVVNGHHRLELAQRVGADKVLVRFIDAADAGAARVKGALQNIAEGRGTAIDAAKVFREGGFTPETLAKEGVSVRGTVAREGMALSRLPETLFEQVISGEMPVRRAAILGESLESHADMQAAADLLWKAEKRGKRLTDSEVKELVRRVQGAERKVETTINLFGEEEITQNLALEEAQISDYIRHRLAKERKLFETAGTQTAAEQLGAAGNVIKAEENRRIAEQAAQAQEVYDKLSLSAGPISDAVREGARRLAEGESEAKIREEVYARVRKAVQDVIGGREAPGPARVEAVAAGGGTSEAAGGVGTGSRSRGLWDELDASGRADVRQYGIPGEGSFWSSESGVQADPRLALGYLKIGVAKMGRGVTDFAAWSAEMVREFGEAIKPHLQRIYQDAQRSMPALKDLDASDYLNFDRLAISDQAKKALRGRVIETVIRTGRFPKEVESWSEIRAQAAALNPEMVKELAPFQEAQPEYRAVRLAAREQVNAQNQAIYEARLKLEQEAGSLTADQLMAREREIDAMERDARGLADVWMRMRSEDGRNLRSHAMMAGDVMTATGQADLTFWLSKAKAAMGLPANATLPDKQHSKVSQAVAGVNDAVKGALKDARNGKGGTGEALAPVPGISGGETRGAPDLPGAMPTTEHRTGPVERVNGRQSELLEPVPGTEHLQGEMRDATGRQADLPGAMPETSYLEGKLPERNIYGEPEALPGMEGATVPNQPARLERAVKSAVSGITRKTENILAGKDPNFRPGALTPEERAIVDNDPRVIAARRRLAQVMAEMHKTGALEAVSALRKAGLLTGIKTHLRNVGGNTVFQVMEEIMRLPAGTVDMALSMFTGTRTVQGMQPKAFAHSSYYAATKGVHDAVEIWKHGMTEDQLAKMVDIPREVNTGHRVIDSYANHVFRLMSAEDRVFKAYAMQRSLQEQAWIISKREGKAYGDLLNHPTEAMQVQAVADAEFATFNNKNFIASKFRQAQHQLSNEGAAGKAAAFAIDIAVPFANTPANIMARMFDYTPLGGIRAGHAAYKAAVNKALSPAEQRTISLAMGRGLTGTALLYMGYKLAEAGLATGMRSKQEGERNVDEAAGRSPGAVLLNGNWRQVAPFSPLGNLIVLGATMFHDRDKPTALASGAARTVLEQPMLKGVNDVLEALKSPDRSAANVASSVTGSFVPTLVADTAGVIDSTRRTVKPETAGESLYKGIQSRIPGLREMLPERYDVLGRPMEQSASQAVDPTLSQPDKAANDPVVRALVANDVKVGFPERRREKDGKQEPAEEYRMRSILAGRLIEFRILWKMDTPLYKAAMPGEARKEKLEDAINDARKELTTYTTKSAAYQNADLEGRLKILQNRIRETERKIRTRSWPDASLPPVPKAALPAVPLEWTPQ